MYGGFADAELFGRSTDGGAVFDDVHSQIAGSLLDVLLHVVGHLLSCVTVFSLCTAKAGYERVGGGGLALHNWPL